MRLTLPLLPAILGKDMLARLVQVNVSAGGMPKLSVPGPIRVTRDGVEGDWQRNRKYHGGESRAICLYSQELYAWLRRRGIDLQNGALGENFTTSGIDLNALAPGDALRVGDCVIQITGVRVPCRSLDQWDSRLHKIIRGHSGWVASVLQEGCVRSGDEIELMRELSAASS
jgi:MOSC domain-containing protein YiiM